MCVMDMFVVGKIIKSFYKIGKSERLVNLLFSNNQVIGNPIMKQ